MVDVGSKAKTRRVAIASGRIEMQAQTLALIERGENKKGDVLATARIAGIMAAKKTAELIPLCHPIDLSKSRGSAEAIGEPRGHRVRSDGRVRGVAPG